LLTLSVIGGKIIKVDAEALWRISMSNEKVHSNQYVVGLKETLKALKEYRVQSLVIAKDVQIHLLTDVLLMAHQQQLPITYSDSSRSLGDEFGIQVKATVAAHLKSGL